MGIIETSIRPAPLGMGETTLGFQTTPEILRPSKNISSPTLLNLNTVPWLNEISKAEGRQLDLPEAISRYGLPIDTDAVWFLGLWPQTKEVMDFGRRWTWQYKGVMPNVSDEDVRGSPYAVAGYEPNPNIVRSWREWDRMRSKLNRQGVRVYVDFIPNHVGVGHIWTREHPDYFIHLNGREVAYNYGFTWQTGKVSPLQIAHGRDPNFRFWEDTLQLNYANPELQTQMVGEILNIARHADGIRVDMAMLVNPNTFLETWGRYLNEQEIWFLRNQISTGGGFWRQAIREVKKRFPDFKLIAEAYWDEGKLIKSGFDYVYAKETLYKWFEDILIKGSKNVMDLVWYFRNLNPDQIATQLRFIENHDEERAALKFGPWAVPALEALVTFMPSGMNMIHDGQYFGRRKKTPIQVNRYPTETQSQDLMNFYRRLMDLKHTKAVQEGEWSVPDYRVFSGSLVLEQYAHRKGILTVCVNLSGDVACGSLYNFREGRFAVMDLISGEWLRPDIIDHNLSDGFGLVLPPWGVQLVMNTYLQ